MRVSVGGSGAMGTGGSGDGKGGTKAVEDDHGQCADRGLQWVYDILPQSQCCMQKRETEEMKWTGRREKERQSARERETEGKGDGEGMDGWREGGREEGRERARERARERGRERGAEGGREEERDRQRDKEKERESERNREMIWRCQRGGERARVRVSRHLSLSPSLIRARSRSLAHLRAHIHSLAVFLSLSHHAFRICRPCRDCLSGPPKALKKIHKKSVPNMFTKSSQYIEDF